MKRDNEEKMIAEMITRQYKTLMISIEGHSQPSVGLQKAAMFAFGAAQLIAKVSQRVTTWSEMVSLLKAIGEEAALSMIRLVRSSGHELDLETKTMLLRKYSFL